MTKLISQSKLTQLKAIGLDKDYSVEDLMVLLNEKYEALGKSKTADGRGWWVEFKDRAENKDIPFEDLIVALAEKELKK